MGPTGPQGPRRSLVAGLHGGAWVSNALQQALLPARWRRMAPLTTAWHESIVPTPQDAAACEAAFMAAHQSLLQPAAGAACALDASTSGASALVLCVEPACPSAPSTSSRLLVASAGACSAVLGRLGPGGGLQAVQLDGDARLSAPLERCRLEGSAPGVRVEADPAAPGGWVLVVDGQGPLPGKTAAAGAQPAMLARPHCAVWLL